jgi:hypothetical protein
VRPEGCPITDCMKRRDLIRELEKMGVFLFVKARSMIVQNPNTCISQPIPRHREIKDPLAKHIFKMLRD